jgi:hypothetical protein
VPSSVASAPPSTEISNELSSCDVSPTPPSTENHPVDNAKHDTENHALKDANVTVIDEVWKTIEVQQKQITILIEKTKEQAARIGKLEMDMTLLHTQNAMKEMVTKRLQTEIGRLEQYTRRYSVIIAGVPKNRNEKHEDLLQTVNEIISDVDSSTSAADIDKFHRNGRYKNGEQDIIVRFKTHSAKETFYKARKSLPRSRNNVKIRPSLAPERKKLLSTANDVLEKFYSQKGEEIINQPEFVMADVHGNLQVKFEKATVQTGSVFAKFNSIDELAGIIAREQAVDQTDDLFQHYSEWADFDMDLFTQYGFKRPIDPDFA